MFQATIGPHAGARATLLRLPEAPMCRWFPERPGQDSNEPIVEDGEVVGVICPDCLTLREQRARRAEQDRIVRRLKRGLPLAP
jgi:hypothetical protein